MAFPARLDALLGLLEPCRLLVDVGTHHGLVPLEAHARGLAERAIGIDRARPLAEADPHYTAYGRPAEVELLAGSGLTPVLARAPDVVVFAGMGTRRIVQILAEHPALVASLSQLVLQPNTEQEQALAWALAHGFRLHAERQVPERGRVYRVMAFHPAAT